MVGPNRQGEWKTLRAVLPSDQPNSRKRIPSRWVQFLFYAASGLGTEKNQSLKRFYVPIRANSLALFIKLLDIKK